MKSVTILNFSGRWIAFSSIRCLGCLLLSLFSLPLLGQSVLSGHVRQSNGQPLSFTNVLLLSAKDSFLVKGIVSDETGSFYLDRITEYQKNILQSV
jgi:hypothetical protein